MRLSLKAMAAAAILAGPAVASAQSYTVFVGYADGLRGAVTFPSPWFGGAGVQYFSGYSGDAPDAGGIMIQNTGAVAIFIQSLVYSLSSPGGIYGSYSYDFGYALPGGSLSLDPGKYAIFTGLNNSGDFEILERFRRRSIWLAEPGCPARCRDGQWLGGRL